ncbi:MAG: ATP-dependent Clp protease ATP-binding subunit [Planctomycetes bacterium]|nr:ATP-dependent Clp protease ATP-binding subunit [Planctomycetota bacterium]MBL7008148.1 ATP-dependent Clp protease ATP-binding subunit [Planctomycetota bacterium]
MKGGRVDLTVFAPAARQAFHQAVREARLLRSGYLGVEHLFLGTLLAGGHPLRLAFERAGLDPERLERVIRGWLRTDPQRPANSEFVVTPRLERVQGAALLAAARCGRDHLGPIELMVAILDEPRAATTRILRSLRARSFDGLRLEVGELLLRQVGEDTQHDPDPLLRFGFDLSEEAASRDVPVIGRETALAAIMVRLECGDCPVIVGEEGIGKGALVRGLAALMRAQGGLERLRSLRLVELCPDSLRLGLRTGPPAPEQVSRLLEEAWQDPRVVLFLRDLDHLLDDNEDGIDAPVRAAITRGKIRCVASTTPGGWSWLESQEPAVTARLVAVEAEEPPAGVALRILNQVGLEQGAFHGVKILEEAVRAALVLSARFLPDRRLPGKAIELLDQACAQPVLAGLAPRQDFHQAGEVESRQPPRQIGAGEIAAAVARASGIPAARVLAGPREVVAGLGEALSSAIVGQTAAVEQVVRAVQAGRITEYGPRVSLLLLGPSGVGKFGLARELAGHLYGLPQRVLRLDMEEYNGAESLAELTGDPGAHGFGREGVLVARLRRAPWSLIYLDHAERAAPAFLDVLATGLEEGHLDSPVGHRAAMEHATLVLASREPAEVLQEVLPPRLLAQLDATACFTALSPADLVVILERRLGRLISEMEEQGIVLKLDAQVHDLLLERGGSTTHGARTLLHTVDRLFLRPLRLSLGAESAPRHLEAVVRHGEIAFLP